MAAALVVAYEPVWAIGTPRRLAEDCESACLRPRSCSQRPSLRVLYGGSVTPENAGALLARSGVSGFLIGGARPLRGRFRVDRAA